MSTQTSVARRKIYRALSTMTERYHFVPLTEGPSGKDTMLPENLVLWSLTCVLNGNNLVSGEPGFGKTTGVKILASMLYGIPYDALDSLEIRANPQKYEEKIVARPHYGALNQGKEQVVWQGSFGLPILLVDEGNRLPLDSQDVILQGIETGRWNYNNFSLFEGKKPTFITMNHRTGHSHNGFIPALKDRFDIVTDVQFYTSLDIPRYTGAKDAVRRELCNQEFVSGMLDSLSRGYKEFKTSLSRSPANDNGSLGEAELAAVREEILGMDIAGSDNEPLLFLETVMAELNLCNQYGVKRSSDPISTDTHDKQYAGVNVQNGFSPRSAMAATDYARALAWFMGEREVRLDHVRYVLPHVLAHKAGFTDDYKNAHGNDVRAESEDMHLARTLVKEIHDRYTKCIQPMKNLIARIQEGRAEPEELDPQKYDHPLMRDMITQAKAPEKAFYEQASEAEEDAA